MSQLERVKSEREEGLRKALKDVDETSSDEDIEKDKALEQMILEEDENSKIKNSFVFLGSFIDS